MSSNAVPTVSWHQRASVWVGIGINPASLTLGAGLAILLPLRTMLPVVALGALFVSLLALLQGGSARRRRQTLSQRAADTFGLGFGALMLNFLIALGMIGWGGFHVGISGASASNLMGVPIWLGTLLIVLGVFVLSEMGIDHWNAFGWVTTLSALALAIWALFITNATLVWDTPQATGSTGQLLWIAGTVITFAILFALRTPDFTCNLRQDADVVKSALSFLLAFLVATTVGAVLFHASGATTLDSVLSNHRYASLGYVFLIVAAATPIMSVLHSGSLALQSMLPVGRRQSTLAICALIFLLGALRFDRQLLTFLDWLSVLLPPALFVMLGTLWQPERIGRRAAVIAWLGGALVALAAKALGQQAHMAWGAAASVGIMFLVAPIGSMSPRIEAFLAPDRIDR